jgi:hypothetical protein
MSLIEKQLKKKAREEKRAKKQRDRLDFDFPTDTARRAAQLTRKEQEKENGRGSGAVNPTGLDAVTASALPERSDDITDDPIQPTATGDTSWRSHGHINFFAEFENAEVGGGPLCLF